ncbi:TPR [Musa troglodytarum]|uniref:TPR n=1 Tax=Musa troglodytarum TaxID=320322 RepID=A0A9E7F6B8_9LILI|nr:TPR [Musa troglodytarum]
MFQVLLEERRELWELPSTCIHLSVAFLFLSSCYYIVLVVPAFLFFEFQPRKVGEMYAEQGLLLPYMLGFPQEASGVDQHLLPFTAYEDLVSTDLPNSDPYMGDLVQTSAISEYDLGEVGDLFKSPESILEESLFALDPITDAMSVMSGYGSTMTEETIKIVDMESIQNKDFLGDAFYDCQKELFAKSTAGVLPEALDIAAAPVQTEENSAGESVESSFLGVNDMNLDAAFGMRRVYSEGDIQILGIDNLVHGSMNIVPSSNLLATIVDVKIEVKIEERREKLSRKALADSQPRIRGRFARMEDRYAKTK